MESEVSEFRKSKQLVKVYWPPMKAPANVSHAKELSITDCIPCFFLTYRLNMCHCECRGFRRSPSKYKPADETSSINTYTDVQRNCKQCWRKLVEAAKALLELAYLLTVPTISSDSAMLGISINIAGMPSTTDVANYH